MPEGTQNVLLPAMDERKIIIPNIGEIRAKPGFTIIATQNPEEFVGTSRLSEALRDRYVWVQLEYQSEEEEREIVRVNTGCHNDELIKLAVSIGRRTRGNRELRRGASVRGAIDIVRMAEMLAKVLGKQSFEQDILFAAAVMALATKIELGDDLERSMEDVIKDVVSGAIKG